MNRRLVSLLLVGGLVLASAALVVAALRPTTPPPVAAAAPEVGALAVVGDTAWRWSGPGECTPEADSVAVERRAGDDAWEGTQIPLVTVFDLAFNRAGEGVALGTAPGCGRGVVVSDDGGASWHYREDNPVLLDAWWSRSYLWGIERGAGPPALHAYVVRDDRLVEAPRLEVTTPCDAADGAASQVAFYTNQLGLLLCEQRISQQRLIARTTTAGTAFDRVADGNPDTGLDGPGPITALEVAGRSAAWVLFAAAAECAEGQLRRSQSRGAVWERLPCVSEAVPVSKILDVALESVRRGTMLATDDAGRVMLLRTRDAGSTWQLTTN